MPSLALLRTPMQKDDGNDDSETIFQ